MRSPADIIRLKRACLDERDAERAHEAVDGLVDMLVREEYPATGRAAIAELAEAYSEVIEDILPRLEAHVLEGLSEPNRVYHQTSVRLAFELATLDPDAAPLMAELLHEAAAINVDEWAVEGFLITMAGSNPTFLGDELDPLLGTPHEYETIRPYRAWALARAHRLDSGAFDAAVAEYRAALAADDTDDRITALDHLGRLGVAVPEAVLPAVPDIVPLTAADNDDRIRVAAVEALGRIGGAEWMNREWFGRFADLDPAAHEALEAAVESSTPAVATVAVRAYAAAAAGDDERRERAVSHLLGRLVVDDDDSDLTTTLVTALDRLTDGTGITEAGSARALLGVASSSSDPDARATALRLLGRVDPPMGDRAAIERTLVEAMDATERGVRRGGIEGAAGVLRRQDAPAPTLVSGLVDATATERSSRRHAFEALADAPASESVVAALCAGVDDPDYSDRAAAAACELGAEVVVETLVSRLVSALDSADRSDIGGGEPDGYPYGGHLDDVPRALLDALNEVTERAPELLVPHAAPLIDAVTDASVPDGHPLAKAVDAVATLAPERVEPFAERLERRLTDARPQDVGYLLDALLAVGAPDDRTLDRVVTEAEASALGVAAARLGDRSPRHCLRVLSALESGLRFDDGHPAVARWIHELDDVGAGDVRVAPAALDLCRLALASRDDWVRWDGAAALARVAETHPERVVTERPALRDGLDDINRHVPKWALAALGHVGEPADRSLIAPFEAHPRPALRAAASDALADLDAGAPTVDERDTPESRGGRYVVAGGEPPGGGDGERTRSLAAVVVALRRSDDSGSDHERERAREILVDFAGVDEVDDALTRLLAADDPVTRGLAADAAGQVDPRHYRDAGSVVDALAARLDDEEPVVRRWVARSLGSLGAVEGVDTPTAGLYARLHDDDAVTRAYVLRALRRIAESDPDRLREGVAPVVHALDDPDDAVRATAAAALALAPPEAVASVEGAPELVVDRFDDSAVSNREAATLVGVLSAGDPTALRSHVDRLVDRLDHPTVSRAVARVAEHDPEAVRPFEDDLADADDDAGVRRALAQVHSAHYPNSLRAALVRRPETLAEEAETVVEYAVTAPDRERRRATVEAVVDTMGWRSASLAAVLRRLVEALSSGDRGVRKNAAEALRVVVSELEGSGGDGDDDTVVEAALSTLLDRAVEDDWEVRSQSLHAVEALVSSGWIPVDDRIVDAAVAALGDEHGRARRRAARILGAVDGDGAGSVADVYDRVVSLAESDEQLSARGGTLALGHVAPAAGRQAEALETLSRRVRDGDPWLRRNAVESVTLIAESLDDPARQVPDSVRDTVRRTPSDRNPVVRAEGCRCLGVIGTADDEEVLIERRDDEDERVRERATTALDRLRERVGSEE